MKRVLMIFLCILTVVITGCTPSQSDKILLVEAIGVDASQEGCKVTLRTFETDVDSDTVSIGKEKGRLISAEGETISSCMQTIEALTGKRVFTGHCMLVVIGKSLYNIPIDQTLRYFVNDNMIFPGINIAYSENDSEQIIGAKANDEIISPEVIKDMLEYADYNSETIATDLVNIIDCMGTQGRCTVIPVLDVITQNDNDEVIISKNAIVKDKVVAKTINPYMAKGINWLSDSVDSMLIEVNYQNDIIPLEINHNSVKIKTYMQDGKPVYKVNIKYNAEIKEYRKNNSISKDKIVSLADMVIEKQCHEIIENVIKNEKADIIGIEKRIMLFNKDYYNQNKYRYDKLIDDISFKININGTVI